MSLSRCQFFYKSLGDNSTNIQADHKVDNFNCDGQQLSSQFIKPTSSFLLSPYTHSTGNRFWSFEMAQIFITNEVALPFPFEDGIEIPEHARPSSSVKSTPPPWSWPTDPSKTPSAQDPFEGPFDISDIKEPCLARIAGIVACIGFAAFCYFNRGSIVQSIEKARNLIGFGRFSFAMI